MKPQGFVISVASVICIFAATIWLARYAPWIAASPSNDSRIARRLRAADDVQKLKARIVPASLDKSVRGSIEEPPPVATQAPYPKVETGRTVYDFGTLLVNTEGRHIFRIENGGEGQLLIAKGPVECSCIVSSISAHEVPPGGSAEVELTWKPPAADSEFHKSVLFWTNDPKRVQVRFSVEGRVPPAAVIAPGRWNAGIVTDDREGTAVGTLTSEVYDQFKIVSVQPTDPNVRIVVKPIAKELLTRSGIRGGYEFTATVGKGIQLGPWRSLIRIFTTLKEANPIEVELTARRSGPVLFLPAIPINGSAHFDTDKLLLNLERFPRQRGSKAAVPAIISSMKDEFRIINVSSADYPFIKISLEHEKAITTAGTQGFRFVFDIPPNAPAATHMTSNPLHVTVTTNHPSLRQIEFEVAFVAS